MFYYFGIKFLIALLIFILIELFGDAICYYFCVKSCHHNCLYCDNFACPADYCKKKRGDK